MELVLQLAFVQKPATFLLYDIDVSQNPRPSGKVMVKAINAARATGYAVLTCVISGAGRRDESAPDYMLTETTSQLESFMKFHSLHEGELKIEVRSNMESGKETPHTVVGMITVICTDHPSQLSASKANQKTPA